MCWKTYNKSNIKVLVAEDNIPVTKIVHIDNNDNGIHSYFYPGFEYTVGETYTTKIHKNKGKNFLGNFWYIDDGFHSYINENITKVVNDETAVVGILVKHLFITDAYFESVAEHMSLGIMSCVIPKGSKYYKNDKNCIVSEVIKPIYCYKVI